MGQFSSRPIRPFDKENIRENMFDFDVNAYDADNELMDLQEELSECLDTFKNDPNLVYSKDRDVKEYEKAFAKTKMSFNKMWMECKEIAENCTGDINEDFNQALIKKSHDCICAFKRKLDGFNDSELRKGDIEDYPIPMEMTVFSPTTKRPFFLPSKISHLSTPFRPSKPFQPSKSQRPTWPFMPPHLLGRSEQTKPFRPFNPLQPSKPFQTPKSQRPTWPFMPFVPSQLLSPSEQSKPFRPPKRQRPMWPFMPFVPSKLLIPSEQSKPLMPSEPFRTPKPQRPIWPFMPFVPSKLLIPSEESKPLNKAL